MPCPNDTTQTGATSGLRTTMSVIVAQALAILIVLDERRRQRCALNRLNDRLLNDIGLSPVLARREADLPCWRR